ncbi:transketolase [Rhodocyclaceae bacterium]
MSMRKQLVTTVTRELGCHTDVTLLLGDIGVFGFREAFSLHPERVFNIGILEGATISLASGMAKMGLVPIVHTIAPFLVERAYEQIKIDFAYQDHGGNFISVGASYDYASLGCTHHCPGDVGILLNIPGMEIIVPGTAEEFDSLFNQAYRNGRPTYFRLSERENSESLPVQFGQATVVKRGRKATIVAIGPTLDSVMKATVDLDVTILYYTTLSPFDSETLSANTCPGSDHLILIEPFYAGTMTSQIITAMQGRHISLTQIGIPRHFIVNYGKAEEHDAAFGLTVPAIRATIRELLND